MKIKLKKKDSKINQFLALEAKITSLSIEVSKNAVDENGEITFAGVVTIDNPFGYRIPHAAGVEELDIVKDTAKSVLEEAILKAYAIYYETINA